MYIVSSSMMRVVFNGRLFLAAFHYISIMLFRATMAFGEELTSIKDTVRCFRHTIYHCITCMIYLTRVWVLAGQKICAKICAWACIWQIHVCSCTFTTSPVIPPVTRSLNEESGEIRWQHNWFGTDLIQVNSVAFHTFLGRILVLISCRARHVCELLHCNVVLWCYGSWNGSRGSLLSRHSASALHTTSDVQLPGQFRLDYNIWGYACPQLVDTIDNLLIFFECFEYTWMLTRSGLIYWTYRIMMTSSSCIAKRQIYVYSQKQHVVTSTKKMGNIPSSVAWQLSPWFGNLITIDLSWT